MKTPLSVRRLRGPALWIVLLLVPAAGSAAPDVLQAPALDLRNLPSLAQILPALEQKRVVFVGEVHDDYSHHLVQLAVIRALHQRHGRLAIGLEFFQQPFQQHLDAYVAGEIDEQTMLRRTEYMERWGFDFRLYRPILQYARDQRIPLVALNVPRELTAKVAGGGIDSLTPAERDRLPDIDRSDVRYRERLRAVYDAHPSGAGKDFDAFVDAQLLWDEGMAERAAGYLSLHPGDPMVILTGSGHVAYGDGIPQRLARRVSVTSAVVLSAPHEELTPDLADFVLFPAPVNLPPQGALGLLMEDANGGVKITRLIEGSAAQAVGMQPGDRIVQIDGAPVATTSDVRLALLDRQAGDAVEVAVFRNGGGDSGWRRYRVELR